MRLRIAGIAWHMRVRTRRSKPVEPQIDSPLAREAPGDKASCSLQTVPPTVPLYRRRIMIPAEYLPAEAEPPSAIPGQLDDRPGVGLQWSPQLSIPGLACRALKDDPWEHILYSARGIAPAHYRRRRVVRQMTYTFDCLVIKILNEPTYLTIEKSMPQDE